MIIETHCHEKRTTLLSSILLAAALSFCIIGCAGTQGAQPVSSPSESVAPPGPAPGAGIAAETVTMVHGKIAAVDTANKQVTLEGPSGKDVTLTVNNPYNLESVKPGDRYVAQFTESINVVGKEPSDKPLVASLTTGLWSAQPGQTPGAVAAEQAHLVVVVSAIDQADKRVTLAAPDGSSENIHVANPDVLQGVQVGDRIAITVTQAVAIALAPDLSGTQ